ncbi:hypothetical protein BCR37DRAFT_404068 [Protomyces lactucae-debilis]|uniref:N-acetylgalactosaminide beta-1,3-galactosyltransferase n=1 Tax=Protomyces lactucae-debilis TaxID=2754530 RepID=A0A1Y2FY99_PROLT|nr:uncharacterized protein BCR37DRAFT_404068 [Protomyces lactucae-debilis]ORY87645.1 hypothetical protein BCR37DRAFT_404068 [Protomyces lactucae-debilis]
MTALRSSLKRRIALNATILLCIFTLIYFRSDDTLPVITKEHKTQISTSVKEDLQLKDVAFILRTGWEVRDRLTGPMDTWLRGLDKDQVMIFSDTDSTLKGYQLHDFVKLVPFFQKEADKNSPHFKYYQSLRQADIRPDSPGLEPSTRNDGWQLDVIKQVASAYLGYKMMKEKRDFKYYVLADDDTYIHMPSLLHVLNKADPDDPVLIGRYWGTSTSESFMLGGAGMSFSRSALAHMFDYAPDLADEMLRTSLEAPIGDGHLSKYVIQAGGRLVEELSSAFYHERLEMRFNDKDRWCAPLATIHHQTPATMRKTHAKLMGLNSTGPVYQRQVMEKHKFVLDGTMWLGSGRSYVQCLETPAFHQPCQFFQLNDMADATQNVRTCQNFCLSGEIMPNCAAWVYRPQDRLCALNIGFRTMDIRANGYDLVGWAGVNNQTLANWEKQCPDTIWRADARLPARPSGLRANFADLVGGK